MWRQLTLALALLFIAFEVPSNAQTGAETLVTVAAGAPLAVECALRPEERAEWRLDGRAPPPDLRAAPERADAALLTARLLAPAARAAHAGLYTCASPPRHRVRVVVRGSAAPTTAGAAAAPEAALPVVWYDVGRYLALNCSLAPAAGSAIAWKKNDTAVENIGELTGRYALEKEGTVFRMTQRTTEDDFGNYTCSMDGASEAWEVRGRPYAKLQHNTNVVENQKIKIVCKVTGKPYPAVTWTFSNATLNGSALEALGARASLETSVAGVAGAVLLVAEAARGDAGRYECAPAGGVPAATTLRVKDQYAALWPFLGICAEVFVLCAIILVYEKRRSKPELDDSDADTHDQKKS